MDTPPPNAATHDPLTRWIGQKVVLDTQGPLIYIGTLAAVHAQALVLCDADVHDCHDSRSSKEFYLAQTRIVGVHVNRVEVIIQRTVVASASLLEAILA
ncbi:MAG: hypothetical protein HKL96_11355 [Phycisphaerales bacterium]|nr:hypothetical protein [Phycisphaerales bacterium]